MFYDLFLVMVHQLRTLKQSHFWGSPTVSSNLQTHFQQAAKMKNIKHWKNIKEI